MMVCCPGLACHGSDHCTQVSAEIAVARVASCQSPSSMRTCTPRTPTCCCQATPAITLSPAATVPPRRGTSMRLASLIGPRSDQPRGVQYPWASENRVTSRSVTHFVAET
ncbi:hypothetical protein MhomT_06155 [Microbacterium hominis]|nr:hypothetical protein MhomT_06155 [Microbacterium hominis]